MPDFVVPNHCTAAFMIDGSGVAFYNNISGNSAFLNVNHCSGMPNKIFLQEVFSAKKFYQMLNSEEELASKHLNWLLNNNFLERVGAYT